MVKVQRLFAKTNLKIPVCPTRSQQGLGLHTPQQEHYRSPTNVRTLTPNSNDQRQGIITAMVSCLLLFLTAYGILGLVQQIRIWRGDLHEKEHIKNRRFGNADYSCCIYNVCGEPSRNEFSLEQYHYLVTVWFVCSCDSRATYCT